MRFAFDLTSSILPNLLYRTQFVIGSKVDNYSMATFDLTEIAVFRVSGFLGFPERSNIQYCIGATQWCDAVAGVYYAKYLGYFKELVRSVLQETLCPRCSC